MSYVALYRKWRPMIFDDLVGQDNIKKILKNQVINQRIAHAYLFSGGRGTGKTSTAKIFSRAVNCLNPKEGNPCNECEICKGILLGNIMDVIEMDAASNNSVDDVRIIRDEVIYTPSVCRYRVYIIDEAHMLSIGAFNALLKILEEPPKHVIFILATTEPHKIPPTILSRCQRFEFKQIDIREIVKRLRTIAESNKTQVDEEALELIARISDGALRDAISMLDQCISEGGVITRQKVIEIIGMTAEETMVKIAEALSQKDLLTCINTIDEFVKNGKDLSQFVSMLVRFFRDLLVYKSTGTDEGVYLMISRDVATLKRIASKFEQSELITIIMSLSELETNLKWASLPRVMIEVEMVKLCIANNHTVKPVGVATEHNDHNSIEKKRDKILEFKNDGGAFEEWMDVISQLKENGKIGLYTNLLGTRATKIDDKTVNVIFPKSSGEFGKLFLSKSENLVILKEAIQKVTGKEMNITCEVDSVVDNNDNEESLQDMGLKGITKIAEKFNIPVNIIDR